MVVATIAFFYGTGWVLWVLKDMTYVFQHALVLGAGSLLVAILTKKVFTTGQELFYGTTFTRYPLMGVSISNDLGIHYPTRILDK